MLFDIGKKKNQLETISTKQKYKRYNSEIKGQGKRARRIFLKETLNLSEKLFKEQINKPLHLKEAKKTIT